MIIFNKTSNTVNNRLLLITLLFFSSPVFASESSGAEAAVNFNLTHHIIGYFAILVTVSAYIAAMMEDVIALRKSKPMVLAAAIIWFAICIYYALHGQAKVAALAFESNLLAYIELLLFILVSMTYLNAMEERRIFDGMRIWLLNKQFSYRQLFWITGFLAFLLSTVVSGLAVGLLMGAVASAVGKNKKQFIGIACVNIVVAVNAGGTFSPLGGISTLFVWQNKILNFVDFFALALPCLVNFLVPAMIMHFFVPKETPAASSRKINFRRGSKRILFFFALTLVITVWANVYLELPPAAGMMAGLALLQFFSFYLTKTVKNQESEYAYAYKFFGVDVPVSNEKQDFDI